MRERKLCPLASILGSAAGLCTPVGTRGRTPVRCMLVWQKRLVFYLDMSMNDC